MAKHLSHPTLTYRLLTWGLFPAALLYTFFIACKYRNANYFYQRIAIYPKAKNTSKLIWCHCASVGEINTALPLLKHLSMQDCYLLVSTSTITGQKVLRDASLENTSHVFFPLDYCSYAKRLIEKFSPKLCLIFETELWPNILLTAANNSIPVAIINGRISDKTLKAPLFLRKNYSRVLNKTCKIFTSSVENKQRFAALGADKNILHTLDNLKFASITHQHDHIQDCPLTYPFFLCASTHAGEEKEIIEQWIASKHQTLGLVIAIRHPQRAKEVCGILEQNKCAFHLHSSHPTTTSAKEVYIIDTVGELLPFMKNAALIFMGGSLVPIGGHNVLEPAQFSKCILIGPHYHNFLDIVNHLQTSNSICMVTNATHLMSRVTELTNNPKSCQQIGKNANDFLQSKMDVLKIYQEAINQTLKDYAS